MPVTNLHFTTDSPFDQAAHRTSSVSLGSRRKLSNTKKNSSFIFRTFKFVAHLASCTAGLYVSVQANCDQTFQPLQVHRYFFYLRHHGARNLEDTTVTTLNKTTNRTNEESRSWEGPLIACLEPRPIASELTQAFAACP